MLYDYACTHCETHYELNKTSTNRDQPLEEPCVKCGEKGTVHRLLSMPALSAGGYRDAQTRAGSGWNDILKGIKKASGRESTIETK